MRAPLMSAEAHTTKDATMTEQELNELIDDTTPCFVESGLERYDIEAIQQGGCASGAYMPAVTYCKARQTMAEHGDDVLQYIQDSYGELPKPNDDESWSGIAVHYLSVAVELWASSFDLDEIEED